MTRNASIFRPKFESSGSSSNDFDDQETRTAGGFHCVSTTEMLCGARLVQASCGTGMFAMALIEKDKSRKKKY